MFRIDPKKLKRLETINEYLYNHRQQIESLEKEKEEIFKWFESDFQEVLSEVVNGYEDLLYDKKHPESLAK